MDDEQRFLDEHGLELFWDEKVKKYTDGEIAEYDATLATVAKTGDYDDLTDKPDIISDVQVNGASVVSDDVANIVVDMELNDNSVNPIANMTVASHNTNMAVNGSECLVIWKGMPTV